MLYGTSLRQDYTSKKDLHFLWPFPQRLIVFKGFEQQDQNSQVSFVVIQISNQIHQGQSEDFIFWHFLLCPQLNKLSVKAGINQVDNPTVESLLTFIQTYPQSQQIT